MTTSGGRRLVTTAVVVIISGLVGAALFAWLGQSGAAPAAQHVAVQRSTAAPTEPQQKHNVDLIRAARLEERLEALEAVTQQKPAPEPAAERPEPPSAREIEEMHEERIRAHQAEALDPGWARTTSAAIAADFKHNEGTHFKVADVQCRSTTCSIVLEWPSRDHAASEWRRALMQPTRANCGRALTIPERPPGETGPMRATLIMDCSTWVSNGSPMLSEEALPKIGP